MTIEDTPISFQSNNDDKQNRLDNDKQNSKNSKNKSSKSNKKISPMLLKAIKNEDVNFIISYISLDTNFDKSEIESLDKKYSKLLINILINELNTSNRIIAIETIYIILLSKGNLENISKDLIGVSTDINKLVYLKGKIDFLKFKIKNNKIGMMDFINSSNSKIINSSLKDENNKKD